MGKDRNKEALDLSEEILRNFELREIPTQNIVLKCLRLARLTNDFDSVEWLKQEANGFELTEEGFMTNVAWRAAKNPVVVTLLMTKKAKKQNLKK